uniref:Leishmanolysin-like peptidase n=1 Tax=Trichuris muris TaxID=70415 RepID=A0A5S6QKL8_TRIMR
MVTAAVPFTALIFCITLANAHSFRCSYQLPKPEEIITSVVQRSSPVLRHRRSKRRFQGLRITPYFDESVKTLSSEKRNFVETNVIHACKFWQTALSVRPLESPLLLDRRCVEYPIRLWDSSCCQKCQDVTHCGEATIPEEHLKPCRLFNVTSGSCVGSAFDHKIGISNTDFVLYVSSLDAPRCRHKENVAYAAHCQMESRLNRPIAGYMNICPHSVSAEEKDHEVLFSTMKHEILHALGFSAALFAFFRDSDGNPLTPRNDLGNPVEFDPIHGFFVPSDKVVKSVVRSDWFTRFGRRNHTVRMMVTGHVQREVRRHFNCSRLEGAELENQGSNGTVYGHWEKRLFENEAMTGTHTQNPVYSRITLALMEDTGWYRANYRVAEHLDWGFNLGCEFAMKNCGEWIHVAKQQNSSPWPYCTEVKLKSGWRDMKTSCNSNRDSLALCHLVEYVNELPEDYQYFDHLNNVDPSEVGKYGGSVEIADFCPFLQEFEWRKGPFESYKDSRCGLASNVPDEQYNGALEQYGSNSACFDLGSVWTQRNCKINRAYPHHGAGCYEYSCADGHLWLHLLNGSSRYPCYKVGQRIHVKRSVAGWYHEGSIVCPSCETLCKIDNFTCLTRSDAPSVISDPPVRMRCGSAALFVSGKFAVLLSFVFPLVWATACVF